MPPSRSGPYTGRVQTPPFPRVGVVGAGQLARMMAGPATELGIPLSVLATDIAESAAQVIPRTVIGRHDEEDAVRSLAQDVEVITFDHEHVPPEILDTLSREGAVAVRPSGSALMYAQDKLIMREKLTALGHPCPPWFRVNNDEQARSALAELGGEAVVKAPRGGYDGRGVAVVHSAEDLAAWLHTHRSVLVEQKVPFVRELSIQVARRPGGETVAYPVVESTQKDGVCYQVVAPAPGLSDAAQESIQRLGLDIAGDLDVVGMLAVELFEMADGSVLVNELAMRPHNTGHWTMDGAVTGQFEQHLRAVADLPLGAVEPLAPVAVMVNLLGGDQEDLGAGARRAMQIDPGVKIHLYGKAVRPGRKVGHVTVTGHDLDALLARARRAEQIIIHGRDPEVNENPVR